MVTGCGLFQQLRVGDVEWDGGDGRGQLEAGALSSVRVAHHLRVSHQGHPVAWKGTTLTTSDVGRNRWVTCRGY